MKLNSYYLITTFLLSVSIITTAQVADDFTDGDFTTNPVWSGEDANFEVDVANKLHLLAPAVSDTSYLSTPSVSINNAVWEFYIEMDFNPSSSNLARIYLASDNANLEGSLNGYFVMVGNTTDEISLYRQDGTAKTEILDGVDGTVGVAFVNARIQVTRDATGSWELLADTAGGTTYVSEGTVFDDTYISSSYVGVHCKYTSTRSDKFWFDDFNITGTGFVDVIPPQALTATAISSTQLDIDFDEPLDQVTAETLTNYSVNLGIGNPSTATLDGGDPSLVHLTFGTPFTNGTTHTVTITNVEDVAGNPMTSTDLDFLYAVVGTPGYKSVVINEIMADPSPQVGLPDAEYVEIYNASDTVYYDLSGWEFSDGTTTATLTSWIMAPGDHVLLIDDSDTALFLAYIAQGFDVMVVSTLPSLNNASDALELWDGTMLVDEVTYSDEWYRDPVKEDGGYSLELINPKLPCTSASNWIASNDPIGGTPAEINSVYDATSDTVAPYIVMGYAHSIDSIKLVFSEALDQSALGGLALLLSNGLGYTESLDPIDLSCLWVETNPQMTPGESFTVSVAGLTDCAGNTMTSQDILIYVPEQADPGDVIINEILFDPPSGGQDFVEIYNRSEKIISLEGWELANLEDSIANNKLISSSALIMLPGDYLVLSKDSSWVQSQYPGYAVGTFHEMETLPTYSNDEGFVYLINNLSEVSDYFTYNADMHFGLLNDVEAVTLERIDFDRPTNDVTNWHSAAESVNFGTPGYLNSQYVSSEFGAGDVVVEPEIFSPDNDGFEDVANIYYEFDTPGYVATIAIYDAHGRHVKWLAQNELLGTSGVISWDGLMESREKAQVGAYVIYFEIFDLSGNVTKFKKACVVAR